MLIICSNFLTNEYTLIYEMVIKFELKSIITPHANFLNVFIFHLL